MIPVVFEDQWLLIADKPSGMLVIPTPKNEAHTLTNLLNEKLKNTCLPCLAGRQAAGRENIAYRLHPCHRLDKDTSGLIIYAKGKSIQQKMMEEFKKKTIKKTYIAFAQGKLAKPAGEIRSTIDNGTAVTRYRVLEQRGGFSVVEVTPLTGRKNQIRLHFKKIGNPILGDTRFVFRRDFKVKAKRLCLHAKTLEFSHPVTGEAIKVESALPEKMVGMLEKKAGPP